MTQSSKISWGLSYNDLASGTVLVDENKWTSLDENELAAIRKTLSENYIELDTTPAINALLITEVILGTQTKCLWMNYIN